MHEPTEQQYARLGRFVAALMGANEEWDSAADYLEYIADEAGINGIVLSSNNEEPLVFWRKIADELDIDHDGGA